MTAYCTLSDLLEKVPLQTLISLTQDDHAATEPNVSIINGFITEAGELIDGSVRGRYPLPMSSVPTLLKSIAVNLVRYEVYARRPDGGDLPDAVKSGQKDAKDTLRKISTGEISLGVAASGQPVPENGPWRMKAPKRRFEV